MNDETERTEKTSQGKVAKSNDLDFAGVIANPKGMGSFLSFEGKASRGEYWATFLMFWFPLVLLSGMFTTFALVLEPQPEDSSPFLSYPKALFIGLASMCLVAANLLMLPILMRRLRDAKISVWFPMAFFALAAVPFPWFGYAATPIILAAGIFPSKPDADETAEKTNNKRFLVVLLIAFAAVMSGSMMSYFTERMQIRALQKKVQKGWQEIDDELKKNIQKEFKRIDEEWPVRAENKQVDNVKPKVEEKNATTLPQKDPGPKPQPPPPVPVNSAPKATNSWTRLRSL